MCAQQNASLNFTFRSDTLFVSISGEIDHHSARGIREKIDEKMFSLRPRLLILDLGEVNFMDSSGLGLILGRLSCAEEMNCALRLSNVTDAVMKILNFAGADRLRGLTVEKKKEQTLCK